MRALEMTRLLADLQPAEQATSWDDSFAHLGTLADLPAGLIKRLLEQAAGHMFAGHVEGGAAGTPMLDPLDKARAIAVEGFLVGFAAAMTLPGGDR